jgi:tRNA A-37 threonylcarbamoyl transferase component Bud32/tetratricopeptide (TPR) repeat protein
MTAEEFGRIRRVFETALEVPEGERQGYLREQCATDEERRAVARLLEAEGRSAGFLEAAGRAGTPAEIGPYRVEREIGRGGMSTVFLGRRADALYDKPVAIKLLDRPVWRQEEVARFRKEIRILASLEHPHIVRLLEGNRAADGRLYIVMEHVAGQLLQEWRAARARTVAEILAVFVQICDAVGYAHRNLIVHRDLKPSNVVVTEDGQAKLLDFGIAKLLGDDEETATGMWRMTVAYASPEQVRGDRNVTVATDVYSLGVVLYELLTGRRPYGDGEGNAQATMRAVLEEDPRPPRAVAAGVPRELDAVVMKALRKDSGERYGTVEELRQDCLRFLGGLPVEAMRGGAAYRMRKFAARHKAPLAAAGLAAGLAGFGVASVLHYAREAEARLVDLVRVNTTIVKALWQTPGRQTAELRVLEESARTLERIWKTTGSVEIAEPLYEALFETGRTAGYPSGRGVGDTAGAERALRKAVEVAEWMRQQRPGYRDDRIRVQQSNCALGAVLIEQNRYAEAERHFVVAVEATRRRAGEALDPGLAGSESEALANLSRVYLHRGDREGCLRLRREVLAIARELLRKDPGSALSRYLVAARLGLLGWAQREYGYLDEALASYRESQELLERAAGLPDELERRQMVASNSLQIGRILRAMGRGKEAVVAVREAVAGYRALLANDPLNVGCQRGLAGSLVLLAVEGRGYGEEAVRILRAVVDRDPQNAKAREELREAEGMVKTGQTNPG